MTTFTPSKQSTAATSSYYNGVLSRLGSHHKQAASISFKRILHHPLASLLTIAVIGIAIALPMLLILLLQNARHLSEHWQGGTQISIYLSSNTNNQRAEQIMMLLKERYGLTQLRYTSPAQGLAEFEKSTGITHIVDQLRSNPLPGVIEVKPHTLQDNPTAFTALVKAIEQFPGVDSVQVDLAWVKRLYQMVRFVKRFVVALGFLLGLSVLLVVGNTIRLSTQHRKAEIKVTKLIGATNAFIRRPFLYAGFFYGLFGAIVAYLVVVIIVHWLQAPIQMLSRSYSSQFVLNNVSFHGVVSVLMIGGLLGLSGAWIAVSVCLKRLEFN